MLTEDYYFVCRQTLLKQQPMKQMLAVLRSNEFHAALAMLPGYAAAVTGTIKTISDVCLGGKP